MGRPKGQSDGGAGQVAAAASPRTLGVERRGRARRDHDVADGRPRELLERPEEPERAAVAVGVRPVVVVGEVVVRHRQVCRSARWPTMGWNHRSASAYFVARSQYGWATLAGATAKRTGRSRTSPACSRPSRAAFISGQLARLRVVRVVGGVLGVVERDRGRARGSVDGAPSQHRRGLRCRPARSRRAPCSRRRSRCRRCGSPAPR